MEQVCSNISKNLNKIRNERGLSLDELSCLTGVSKSMLAQIERGSSVPTIATLWKIANGLKISFTSLISISDSSVEVKKLRDQNFLGEMDGNYRVYPIINFDPEMPIEMYYLEINPGTRYDSSAHFGNVKEHILVLKGELTLIIDTKEYIVNKYNAPGK